MIYITYQIVKFMSYHLMIAQIYFTDQFNFKIIQTALRSEIASENATVRAFAGETRFYVAEKA